jgi:speckle-type POZ protein
MSAHHTTPPSSQSSPLTSPQKKVYASTRCNTLQGSLDWHIERYSLLEKDLGFQLNSPEFCVAGHKWFAALYPNGEDEASKDYVSCFLILASTASGATSSNSNSASGKEKEVRARISFSFIGNKHKLFRESCNTFVIPKTNNWGWDNLDLSLVVDDLIDDTLQIHIEIEVISGWMSSAAPTGPQVVMHKCTLLDDFQALLSEDIHSDVTFVINGARVPAHRAILSVRSPVFRRMFASGMLESTKGVVDVVDIEMGVFMEVLKYVYCGKCDEQVLSDKVLEVLAAADRYDINGLKLLCSDILISRLHTTTAAATLLAADTYHALDLKKQVLVFITKYFMDVFTTEDFKDLCLRTPHLVAEIQESVSVPYNTAHSPAKNRDDAKYNDSGSRKKRKHD